VLVNRRPASPPAAIAVIITTCEDGCRVSYIGLDRNELGVQYCEWLEKQQTIEVSVGAKNAVSNRRSPWSLLLQTC